MFLLSKVIRKRILWQPERSIDIYVTKYQKNAGKRDSILTQKIFEFAYSLLSVNAWQPFFPFGTDCMKVLNKDM